MTTTLDTVKVYLGLGSNLGDREANLQTAVRRLGKQVAVDALVALGVKPGEWAVGLGGI